MLLYEKPTPEEPTSFPIFSKYSHMTMFYYLMKSHESPYKTRLQPMTSHYVITGLGFQMTVMVIS